ncbi:uncharacterized protein [Chelonus insularis]|nr:uncharacterized protein LOC118064397 [Chelonus insularis]
MPKQESLSRTVNRIRLKNNPQPLVISSRGDLQLSSDLTQTHSNELFLLHDSGGNKKRFLMFTTAKNLNYLSRCQHWLGDGTFKSVPHIFAQLYSIHGYVKEKSIPLVYILSPDKSKSTYTKFLTVLRANLPNFSPQRIIVDFEEAFIQSFKTIYPNVKISGCNFHFNQCVWRHIQSCGLQKLYNNDIIFATNIHLLTALAFIPSRDVIEGYEWIVSTDYYDRHSDILDEFLNYFETTWIGKTRHNKKKREKPKFDIKLWNAYRAVTEDLLRSNNPIEGWHNSLNRRVATSHASIPQFLNALKNEQVKTELLMTQLNTGLNVSTRRKAYRDYDTRLKNVILHYTPDDKLTYLKNVAKIISLNTN